MAYMSPAYLSALIVEPLRWFFERHVPKDIAWNSDPAISSIEIDTINNFNKILIQAKPRILISRGGYSISGTSISDSLFSGKSFTETKGLKYSEHLNMLNGVSQILIEARSEGVVERILDITSHFVSWTGPLICTTHNFKQFGANLNISPCTPGKDDTEIFQASINVPWSREEIYKSSTEGIQLKQFLLRLTSDGLVVNP